MSSLNTRELVDVITVELVKNALSNIAQEMQVALERGAYSHGIRESGDASSSLFDRQGRLIAQALSLPVQLAGSGVAVKEVLKRFPAEEMHDGDVYGLNHAFYGGSHPPDIILVKPYYRDHELIGFGCSYGHHFDLGGMMPGSTPPLSTEIYQEGFLIPPMRIVEGGNFNETLMTVWLANVRRPDILMGDLRAQVGSLSRGADRFNETLDRFGAATVMAATEELLRRTEVSFSRLIAGISDGVYTFEDVLDDDGIDLDVPIPVKVTITVSGEQIKLDFTGTAQQVRGSLNSPLANSLSAVYASLKMFLDPHDEIPNNEGCYSAVEVVFPKGSLLNPDVPASVASRPETQARLSNVVMGALGHAIPDHALAQDSGQAALYVMSGENPDTGKRFMNIEALPGGWGGRAIGDGPDVVDFPVSNINNAPVEALEMGFPIRIECYELRSDSAGAGRYRGGLGLRREIKVLVPVTVAVRAERHRFAPSGVFGGTSAATGQYLIRRVNGEVDELLCKQQGIEMSAGDVLVVLTPGGGGYGPPGERDPEDIARDIRQGKVMRVGDGVNVITM